MPSASKMNDVQTGFLKHGATLVVALTTVLFSMGTTQSFAEDRKVSAVKLTDLVAFPSWRQHAIPSGAVKRQFDSESIANIILVRAVSSAMPDLWFAAIRRALSEAGDFFADPHEGQTEDFWLEAVLITKDGKHLLIQLNNDNTARLTGDSFHGHFKYAENRPAPKSTVDKLTP